jgi:hypothetical protein
MRYEALPKSLSNESHTAFLNPMGAACGSDRGRRERRHSEIPQDRITAAGRSHEDGMPIRQNEALSRRPRLG